MKKNNLLKVFFIIGIVTLGIFLMSGCSDSNTIRSNDFDEGAFLIKHSTSASSSTQVK